MTPSVANAAEAPNGLPAKVEPWEPGVNSADSSAPKEDRATIGKPPPTPLAKVTMSG